MSLVRHLGGAPAGLRAPLAAAAIEPLTGRKSTHAGLFSLARAAIAHQVAAPDDAAAAGDVATEEAVGELSTGDAGAAAAAVFARFPWPLRLAAVRKLLEWFVEPEEMARGGKLAVAFAAAEVAALKAAAGQVEDEGVQEALKGVLNASLSILTSASEVRFRARGMADGLRVVCPESRTRAPCCAPKQCLSRTMPWFSSTTRQNAH